MLISRYSEITGKLNAGSPGDIFLVCGEELYQMNRLQETAMKRFVGDLGYEFTRLEASELTEGDVKQHISENSLFSSGTFILISAAHKLGRAATRELMDAIDTGISNSAILLLSENRPGKSAVLSKIAKKVITFICYEPFENRMSGWARNLCSDENIRLTPESIQHLTDYYGRNLLGMAGTIQKLALYCGGESAIKKESLLEVISGKGTASIFDLGDYVFGRKKAEALVTLRQLLKAGEEPIVILSFLYSYWKKVLKTAEVLRDGGGEKQVGNATGARFPQLQKLMKYGRLQGSVDPAAIADAFAKADTGLKTGIDSLVVFATLFAALSRHT